MAEKRGFTKPTVSAPAGFEIEPVSFRVGGKDGEELQGWGLKVTDLKLASETAGGEDKLLAIINAANSKTVYTQGICRGLWGKGLKDGNELISRVLNWVKAQRNSATVTVIEKTVQVYRLPDGSTTTDEAANDLAWMQHAMAKMAEKRAK